MVSYDTDGSERANFRPTVDLSRTVKATVHSTFSCPAHMADAWNGYAGDFKIYAPSTQYGTMLHLLHPCLSTDVASAFSGGYQKPLETRGCPLSHIIADDVGTVRATKWDETAQQCTAKIGEHVKVSNAIVEKDFFNNKPCMKINDIKSVEIN